MKVTDEMVERACLNWFGEAKWGEIGQGWKTMHRADFRSNLEAVLGDLPELRVPDALPAIQVCQTYMGEPVSPEMAAYHEGWNACCRAMLSAAPTPPRGER